MTIDDWLPCLNLKEGNTLGFTAAGLALTVLDGVPVELFDLFWTTQVETVGNARYHAFLSTYLLVEDDVVLEPDTAPVPCYVPYDFLIWAEWVGWFLTHIEPLPPCSQSTRPEP